MRDSKILTHMQKVSAMHLLYNRQQRKLAVFHTRPKTTNISYNLVYFAMSHVKNVQQSTCNMIQAYQ